MRSQSFHSIETKDRLSQCPRQTPRLASVKDWVGVALLYDVPKAIWRLANMRTYRRTDVVSS